MKILKEACRSLCLPQTMKFEVKLILDTDDDEDHEILIRFIEILEFIEKEKGE